MPGGILPPLSVIGSWPTPNYKDPVSRGWGLVVICSLLGALSTIVVCARIAARIKRANMGIDDYLIVVSLIPALGMTILICIGSRLFGFNHHIWDNTLETSIGSRKLVMAIEALYVFGTGTIKVSILLFYRRLVAGTFSRFFVWAVRLTIFSVLAYMITFELTLIFGCKPMSAYWDQVNPVWRGLTKYSCIDEVATLFAANITSIVQDFLAFMLPLLLFRKLKLPHRQKVILGGIFGVGFLLCIVGIIRIVYTRYLYFTTYDATWATEPVFYWTAVEVNGAIMCASAPALKVYFKRFLKGSSTGRSGRKRAKRSNDDSSARQRQHDVEKDPGYSSMSYGTEGSSRLHDASLTTFVGADSTIDEYETVWPGKLPGQTDDGGERTIGAAEYYNDYGHFDFGSGVSAAQRPIAPFTTPHAVLMPIRKQGSGALVDIPRRHFE